jgi:hypothetical protein
VFVYIDADNLPDHAFGRQDPSFGLHRDRQFRCRAESPAYMWVRDLTRLVVRALPIFP